MNLSDMPTVEECQRKRELIRGLISKYQAPDAWVLYGSEHFEPSFRDLVRGEALVELQKMEAALTQKIAGLGMKEDT